VIETRGGGYLVRVGELDLARFEHLIEEGGEALADGAPGARLSGCGRRYRCGALRRSQISPIGDARLSPFARLRQRMQ
jgi:hypothetical protein